MTVQFEIDERQAAALAQVLKRIGFSDVRRLSEVDAEAYDAQAALETIRAALAVSGYNPR